VRVCGEAGHTLVLGVGGCGKLGGGGGASFVAVIGDNARGGKPCSLAEAQRWRTALTGGAALARSGYENAAAAGGGQGGGGGGGGTSSHRGTRPAHAWSSSALLLSLDGSFAVLPVPWHEESAVATLLVCAGGGGGADLRDGGDAALRTAGDPGLGQVSLRLPWSFARGCLELSFAFAMFFFSGLP